MEAKLWVLLKDSLQTNGKDDKAVLNDIEESLTPDEYKYIEGLLKWLKDDKKTIGNGNWRQVTLIYEKWVELMEEVSRPIRITFEDNGQDFLIWDVMQDGRIIDCQPAQGAIWCKKMVIEPAQLTPGRFVNIRAEWEIMKIKHKVKKVERIKLEEVRKTWILVELEIQDGEHIYYDKTPIEMSLVDNEEERADRLAKMWYDCEDEHREWNKETGYWEFYACSVAVKVLRWTYISKSDYLVLKKYL